MSESTIKTSIRKKLNEYGFIIADEYALEINSDYIFLMDSFVLFLKENDNVVISFNVAMTPDVSANIILMLQEVKLINKIRISENHIIKEDNTILKGNDALVFFYETFKNNVIDKYEKHATYADILDDESVKFHKC